MMTFLCTFHISNAIARHFEKIEETSNGFARGQLTNKRSRAFIQREKGGSDCNRCSNNFLVQIFYVIYFQDYHLI